MEHVYDNIYSLYCQLDFWANEQFRNADGETITRLFIFAADEKDDEKMKALIFPGSPILSAELHPFKDTCLHVCCLFNPHNLVIPQLLIDFGIDINKQDTCGLTALHTVVSCRINPGDVNCDLVRLLLRNGANRDLTSKFGLTPIQVCLFLQHLEEAEEFLKEEDKLPNVHELDRTKRCRHLVKCLLQEKNVCNVLSIDYSIVLHFLINENDEETFEYVVNNTKFDANADFGDRTLLHLAAELGTPRMIRALFNVGADLETLNKEQKTPLMCAISCNRKENVHCLLDCGASISGVETNMYETNTPLHYAVCAQYYEIVERLVKMGADVNALTYHRSPLLLACGNIYSNKWFRSPPSGSIFVANTVRNAFVSRNVKIVELLLNHGADMEAKNASNRTALDQACRFGNLDIVKLLLSRGAKINQGDVSTLHHAVRGENSTVVKLILEQGANVNYRCAPEKMLWERRDYVIPPPRTPLECALDFIHEDSICKDIVELLIEYGVNINVSDPVRSETPLHLVCLSNKTDNFIIYNKLTSRPATIKLLLRHNVNVNALDAYGLTPLHYALHNYNLMNGRANVIANSSNRFKPDLEALISFIANMMAKKEFIIEENLILFQDNFARPMYHECMKELSFMKKNICESRNFSFFNMLSKDIECLGAALKNEDIFQVLKRGEYKKTFPIYAEYLEYRILYALTRQSLIDLSIVLFQKHVNKNISVEIMLNIFKFLSLQNFKNFAKSCFVDVEGK